MERSLARHPLFRALPAQRRNALARRCVLQQFRKGQALFQEGRRADAIWLIQQGWVYLTKRAPLGAEATIYTVTPEDGLCGFSVMAGQGAYFASAVAATDTTALRMPRAAFVPLLRRQPAFAAMVLALYHTRMRHLAEAISLASSPVEQRLAHTLLRLQASFGSPIPVTHQELARMAGMRWETSIRTLSAMKRRGWIASARGRVTILVPQSLRACLHP